MNKKTSNILIVGGMIAAGKSTLVEMLSSHTAFPAVSELREDDKVQSIILQKLYEQTRIHLETVQFYFISNRYRQYKEIAQNVTPSILDRGVWEDFIFAKLLMENDPKTFAYYIKLWTSTIKKLIDDYGIPKAYIFVKIDWETFKDRIYTRNRHAEIANFSNNENYFKQLLNEYNTRFEPLLKEWGIDPITIDSSVLTKDQMLEKTIEALIERGLYNN